jgi:hypothetical protein
MLHVLQWYTYVASSCCQYFICFFSDVCCKCVYLDVAYVFTHMMQVFYMDVVYIYNHFMCFLGVFASVSDACFKCFICFHTYVVIVAYECFKTRSTVASPSSLFCCLASVLGEGRQRRSPLVRASHCIRMYSQSVDECVCCVVWVAGCRFFSLK